MTQHCSPPAAGLVLEVGSGDNPHPRADVLVDRFLHDNTERGGSIVRDTRPLVVADAHALPFRSGAFAYTICSHILEHMDNPPQFARELERVAPAGYIGCPSEIAERMFHWSFHRWYVNLVDNTLVLHPKEQAEPFGELFDYLYAYNPAYAFFQRSMPHLFWVDYEWRTRVPLRMAEQSPLDLRDPAALHDMVRPRGGVVRMLLLLVLALLARMPGARAARTRLARLLRRSYF